uniref:Peptidase M1 membrane alanine aminopeptidase domain-containing protein n=1 Tax=Parascaris equorum TaxID=6256 RepID=A0A914S074_PAREQ
MICLVILAIFIVLGRAEVLPAESSSSELFVQPTNASPVFFDAKDIVGAENLPLDIESTTTLDSKKSIVGDFSTPQGSAPKTTTETSTISFTKKSTATNSTTNSTAPTSTTMVTTLTTPLQGNSSLSKAKTFVGEYSDLRSIEPIIAVLIDFENPIIEFNNSDSQEEYNTTTPTPTLSGHEDSEVLSLQITDANSSTSSPLNSRLRHKILEELTPQCVKKKAYKCRPSVRKNILSREDIPTEEMAAELGHFGGIRAIHYALNLTINHDMHTSYQGTVEIMLKYLHETDDTADLQQIVVNQMKVIENTSTIFINYKSEIIELLNEKMTDMRITEEVMGDLQLKKLIFETLIINIIILRISNFTSPRSDKGLLVQNPQKWEPKRIQEYNAHARSVMPCFDLPSMKATLDLCVSHPLGTEARMISSVAEAEVHYPKLSYSSVKHSTSDAYRRWYDHVVLRANTSNILYPEQMTAERPTWMKLETIQANSVIILFNSYKSLKYGLNEMNGYAILFATDSVNFSFVLSNVFFQLLNVVSAFTNTAIRYLTPYPQPHVTAQALLFMSNFTGFEYPLKKLSLIATSLPINGVENFGLITLNERWMAYPKYRMAHSILAHEIVHQWIGNVVTVTKW